MALPEEHVLIVTCVKPMGHAKVHCTNYLLIATFHVWDNLQWINEISFNIVSYLTFPDDDNCFNVKLATADYGDQISWSLGSCQGLNRYHSRSIYIKKCCLAKGIYTLKCKSAYKGWHGGYIEVFGQKYCDSFLSGSEHTSQITVGFDGKYFSHLALILTSY